MSAEYQLGSYFLKYSIEAKTATTALGLNLHQHGGLILGATDQHNGLLMFLIVLGIIYHTLLIYLDICNSTEVNSVTKYSLNSSQACPKMLSLQPCNKSPN